MQKVIQFLQLHCIPGLMDIVIFLGPKPADVMSQYSKVFGASYLPPVSLHILYDLLMCFLDGHKKIVPGALLSDCCLFQMFAISYHQCRWNYNDQQDVEK